jgi:uncharacterized protein YbjT (DUF2867 family)
VVVGFQAVLGNPSSHTNKTYKLVSDTVTFNEIAESFTKAIGSAVAYVQVPYAAAEAAMVGMGFPAWQAGGVLELLQLVDSSSAGSVADTSDLELLLGHAPTSFGTWAGSVADAFKA